MISKRFLLVSFCFVVLAVAVGAYGYILYREISSLGSRLEDLQREINLLKYRIGFMNTSKTFNFFWGDPIAEKFNVSTFWMNITFQRVNETHLTVMAKTNDLGYSYCVGIVFDVNRNGEIDKFDDGWMYMAQKYYCDPYYAKRHAFLDGPYNDSQRFFHTMAESYHESAHTCDFDSQLGYTYVIPVNLQELKLTNDLIHVEYWGNLQDGKANMVSVEFCFGMELIA